MTLLSFKFTYENYGYGLSFYGFGFRVFKIVDIWKGQIGDRTSPEMAKIHCGVKLDIFEESGPKNGENSMWSETGDL